MQKPDQIRQTTRAILRQLAIDGIIIILTAFAIGAVLLGFQQVATSVTFSGTPQQAYSKADNAKVKAQMVDAHDIKTIDNHQTIMLPDEPRYHLQNPRVLRHAGKKDRLVMVQLDKTYETTPVVELLQPADYKQQYQDRNGGRLTQNDQQRIRLYIALILGVSITCMLLL